MISLIAPFLALFLAATGSPEEERLKPLHFRMEVNTDRVRSIFGRLEPSPTGQKSYDRVVLDPEGEDGPEETLALDQGRVPIQDGWFNASFKFDLGGWIFNVELYGPLHQAARSPVNLLWSLLKEEQFIYFVGGKTRLFSSPEEAKKGKAFRLGPPFRFQVSSRVQGPDALIRVGVKDANDATLRVAVHHHEEEGVESESRIRLTFLSKGEKRSVVEAEYG
jgi:hypothetical protein